MNLIEKYQSYTDLQKQILGILFRTKKIEKDDLKYFTKRLLRYMPMEDKEKEFLSHIDFLFSDVWCMEENEEVVLRDEFSSETESLHAIILEDREKWRLKMIHDVCNYVGIEENDPVVNGLKKIDRAHFLREDMIPFADIDCPLPLYNKMTESALHAVLMTINAVEPKAGEKILICGVKGGYLCALLSALVGETGFVRGLDWDEEICTHTDAAINRYPDIVKNSFICNQPDVTLGLNEHAPFDIVIVNGCIPQVPLTLMGQLHESKGRILFYLHSGGDSSVCYLVHKNQSILQEKKLSNFLFTPIPGKQGFVGIQDLQKQYEDAGKKLLDAREDLSEINRKIPYPIARMLTAAYNARNSDERHKAVLKIAEVYIRYLAFISISRFDFLACQDQRVAEYLMKISDKPSNGDWPRILRATLKSISKEDSLGAELIAEYEKNLRIPQVMEALRSIDESVGKQKRGGNSVKVCDFLDAIFHYRNKSAEGHGGMYSSGHIEGISDLLLKSFIRIFLDSVLFQNYFLIEVHRKEEMRIGKKFRLELFRLNGIQHILEILELDKEAADDWHRGVALITKDKYVQSLSPWLVWTDEGRFKTPDMFMFNGKDEYITYYNADVYPDKQLSEELNELKKRHPVPEKPKYDSDVVKNIIMGFMPIFTADGLISRAEMVSLISAVKTVTAMSDEDCERFILDIIYQEFPDVHIEQ
ncbi:MAG: hypothetical protein FJY17_04205 [Bacteroidetes bacterium]|nr:hypothetical protein [Bacteroidota bacterium]